MSAGMSFSSTAKETAVAQQLVVLVGDLGLSWMMRCSMKRPMGHLVAIARAVAQVAPFSLVSVSSTPMMTLTIFLLTMVTRDSYPPPILKSSGYSV